jgi:hypothetical protein
MQELDERKKRAARASEQSMKHLDRFLKQNKPLNGGSKPISINFQQMESF